LSEDLQTVFDKFEFRVRKGYSYTEDDLWVSVENDRVRLGISDYLQRTSGDAAFIEIAKEGSTVERHAELAMIETAKTTVSLHSPFSGKIEEVNQTLTEKPELLNLDPYGEGWLVTITPQNLENDLKSLMAAEHYFQLMTQKLQSGKLESR